MHLRDEILSYVIDQIVHLQSLSTHNFKNVMDENSLVEESLVSFFKKKILLALCVQRK